MIPHRVLLVGMGVMHHHMVVAEGANVPLVVRGVRLVLMSGMFGYGYYLRVGAFLSAMMGQLVYVCGDSSVASVLQGH